MKILILSILILLPSLGQAEWTNWHPVNEKLFKSFIALNVVDTMQTFDLINCQNRLGEECPYHEKNRILGTHPSKTEVLLVKTIFIGGSYYLLDKGYPTPQWLNSNKPKFVALVIMNMVYIDIVSENQSIGLKFNWNF